MNEIIQSINKKLTIKQKEYLKTITDDKEKIKVMNKLLENYSNGDFLFKDILDKEGKIIGASEDQLKVFNLDKQLGNLYKSLVEIDEQIKELEKKKNIERERVAKIVREIITQKCVDGKWEFCKPYSDKSTPYKVNTHYVYAFKLGNNDEIKILGHEMMTDFYRNSYGEDCRNDYAISSVDYLVKNPERLNFDKYLSVINILKQVI